MNLRQKRMLMTGGCADRFNLRPPGADVKRNVKMQDLTLSAWG